MTAYRVKPIGDRILVLDYRPKKRPWQTSPTPAPVGSERIELDVNAVRMPSEDPKPTPDGAPIPPRPTDAHAREGRP